MPSSYDGDIKLSVTLSTKDVKQQANALQKEIEGIFEKTSGQSLDKNFQKLQISMSKSVARAKELQQKLSAIETSKVPTQEYVEIQNQIKKATSQLMQYRKTEDKMLQSGDTNSKKWITLQSNIEESKNTIAAAKLELEGLVQTGQAFKIGGDPEELDKVKTKLAELNNQMRTLVTQANEYQGSMSGQKTGQTKLPTGAGATTSGTQRRFQQSYAQILKYGLAMSLIYRTLSIITSGLVEGITNVSKFGDESNKTAQSVNALKDSVSYLQNAWGAAFAPIINFVTPALTMLIDALAKVGNMIAGFMATITGQGTYIKAVKQQTAIADAIEGTGAAAEEASGQLADFDELNVIGTQDTGGGGGGTDVVDYDSMFQTVSVSSSLLDALEKIKQLVSAGFWDGFGADWKERVAEIQNDCASIQASLIDIFTDSSVVSSASQLFDSLFYNLGRVAGSIASVGLTIGEALVGGIEVYLSSSGGFLKQALSGIFSDAAGILDLAGLAAQVTADIFSVFGDQWSQNIVGMVLGTIANAIVTKFSLILKRIKDLAGLIVIPIADNAELIKTAISQVLQAISMLLTPFFNMLQTMFSWMLTAYDAYISPLIGAITAGLSQLLGGVLTELTTNVLPNLISWTEIIAEKLNTAWTEIVQPIIDQLGPAVSGAFNAAYEAGKMLWDNLLSPLATFLTGTFGVGLNDIITLIGATLVVAIELLATTVDIAGNAIIGVINALTTIFNGLVTFIQGTLLALWEAAWNTAELAFTVFSQSIGILIEGVQQLFSGLIDFIAGIFTGDWSRAWNGIVSFFQGIANTIGGIVSVILAALVTVITFVANTFRSSWSAAWNGIKDIFRGVWNGIASICESVVNGIIRALNRISVNVPNWVPIFGGKRFGFNLNTISIPRLAQGAVIPPNKEFLAVLGDQKSGTNVETPLSTIEDAVRNVIGSSSISDPRVVQLLQELIEVLRNKEFSISKRDVGKTAVEYINSETRRTGLVPIKG